MKLAAYGLHARPSVRRLVPGTLIEIGAHAALQGRRWRLTRVRHHITNPLPAPLPGDKFNTNNFFIKYTIPEGTTLKAWKGKAAEQFDGEVGQYLPGGGEQLFVDFPAHIKAEVVQLPALSTGWGKTTKRYGYGPQADAAIGEIELERLAANEVRTKMTGTGP